MDRIQEALNKLYLALDEPENSVKLIEQAIEVLEYALDDIASNMATEEVVEIIKILAGGGDIEPIIYELEVMNNEL